MINSADYPLWNSPAMNVYLKSITPETMLAEGAGVRVRDAGGRWLLDARSGLWNVTLGYDHQGVIEAIKRQLDTLPYANVIGYGRPSAIAMEAAKALVPHLPAHLNKVRYCSNGSQAVETSVLLSRFLHRASGAPQRSTVFGLWQGFHGLGAGGGALTGLPYLHYQAGPVLPDVLHGPGPYRIDGELPSGDLRDQISEYGPERVAAVVVEPVVGEGGHVLSGDYLSGLAEFTAANGIHLIVDEVTTGMGRVGAFTRVEQLGVRPDILTLGKGLSAGYAPVAAVVLSDEIYEQLLGLPYDRQFFVGSTNDGHPLAMAASIAVINALTEEGVLDNVNQRAGQLEKRLTALAGKHPHVKAVRGTGLMYAVELADLPGVRVEESAANYLRLAMETRGVLVSTLAMWPAIMLMPPLVISEEELDEVITVLDEALTDVGEVMAARSK